MSKWRDQLESAMDDGSQQGIPSATKTYNTQITPPSAPPPRPSKGLISSVNGEIQIGGFALTDVGIFPSGKMNKEDWVRVESVLRKVHRSFRWILADWLAFGEQHSWGDKYAEAAKWTGLKEKTLREYAYVAANVSLSIRMDKLTLAHHQLVAALSRDKQIEWLTRAVENKWNTKRLYAEINQTPLEEGEGDPLGIKQFSRRTRALGRFVEYVAKTQDDLDPKELEKARADLEVAEAWIADLRAWVDKQLKSVIK